MVLIPSLARIVGTMGYSETNVKKTKDVVMTALFKTYLGVSRALSLNLDLARRKDLRRHRQTGTAPPFFY